MLALHFRYNSLNVIDILLASGADVTARNVHGSSALHIASMCGHLRIVKRILKQKQVSVYDVDNTDSIPLQYACAHNHLDVCRFLFDRGEDGLKKRDSEGRTALHLAAAAGHKGILIFLISSGKQ